MPTGRPRHEARRRGRGPGRGAADTASRVGLALLAIGLVCVVLLVANTVGGGRARPEGAQGGPLPTAVPVLPATPSSSSSSAAPVNRLANPGFTRDLNGWLPTPAAFTSWLPDGRSGPGAMALRRNPRVSAEPEGTVGVDATGVRTRAVDATVAGERVTASVWLGGTRPGTTVVARLVERDQIQELGAEVARTTVPGRGWRRLQVAYEARSDRAAIDLELTVTGLGTVALVVVDDASVIVARP
jgi:hypothetical protein